VAGAVCVTVPRRSMRLWYRFPGARGGSRWSRRADYQEYVRCQGSATEEIATEGFIVVSVEQMRKRTGPYG
jgi:hypothetical protein